MQRPWIFNDCFKVEPSMVINGKMIKEKIPDEVNGIFICSDLELTTLEGSPIKVWSSFKSHNNLLKDLKGSPKYVYNHFHCIDENLKSLEGCPIFINGNLRIKKICNLSIEQEYVKTSYFNPDNYWLGLLKFMIISKIDLNKVLGWPKDFLNQELIDSVSALSKFNL